MTKFLIFLFCGLLSLAGCKKNFKPEDDNVSPDISPEDENVCSTPIASGTAGTLTWVLCEEGTLTISGKGVMPDYLYQYPYETHKPPPWYEYQDNIIAVFIGDDVCNIGNYAFFQYRKITSIAIGKSITIIGRSAFQECEGLTSVEIPNSVTNIKPYAFTHCTGLSSVTIGNSVNDIENHAFSGCSALTKIVNYQEIPPQIIPNSIGDRYSIPSGTFFDVNNANCTLLVHSGSIEAYSAAEGWKYFVNIKSIQ